MSSIKHIVFRMCHQENSDMNKYYSDAFTYEIKDGIKLTNTFTCPTKYYSKYDLN